MPVSVAVACALPIAVDAEYSLIDSLHQWVVLES